MTHPVSRALRALSELTVLSDLAAPTASLPVLTARRPRTGIVASLLGTALLTATIAVSVARADTPTTPRAPAQTVSAMLQPAQLQADLESLRAFIDATHPDISHSASPQELEKTYADIAAQLNRPMTAEEFWQHVARLNPLFNDGHWSVNLPATNAAAGGQTTASSNDLFPLEVHVRPDGELTVLSLAGGGDTPLRGASIEQINGEPAASISKRMLALRHGDNPLHRANLLGPSFQQYFRTLYGSPAVFTLQLKQNDQPIDVSLPASALPAKTGAAELPFAETFSYRPLGKSGAYLKLGSFYWEDEAAVGRFTREAFTQMKQSSIDTLIIDVRENRGGNDSVWVDHVLPYLADRAWRVGSHNRRKVIASRASATEPAGAIIDSEFKTWYDVAADQSLRFPGKVYVLIGRRTYSSAVQFSNVMQDFGFATLVGEGAMVRSRSTGGIQFHTLPNSKLRLIVPRFWAARPSGGSTEQLLTPDWLMRDDPLTPDALVDAVLARHQRLAK